MTVRVRPITQFRELDTRKHYQMYDNMTPEQAAEKFRARYGTEPAEVLVYGDQWLYIEQTPLAALTGRRR